MQTVKTIISRARLLALAASAVGTAIFYVFDLPLPFMLGPMFACLIAALAGAKLQALGHLSTAMRIVLGIAVGTGSACHDDGAVSISPVLSAMGVEEFLARGTLRISLGWTTTREEIDEFLVKLIALIESDDDSLNCVI